MGPSRQVRIARTPIGPSERHGSLIHIVPAVLMLYASVLPPEVRFTLADQVFFAPRIVGFACLPWLWLQFASRRLRFEWRDGAMVIASVWMIGSFAAVYGIADGVIRGGALAIDMALPYFVARASISTLTDLRRILILFAPGLIAAGLTLPIESLVRTPLVRPLFSNIFGSLPVNLNGEVVESATKNFKVERFGLLRALGPFPHPILAGLALGTLGAFYWSSGVRGWPRVLGAACMLTVFFTLSSAAIAATILGLLFIGYDWLQKRVAFLNWRRLVFGGGLALAVIQLATTNGVAGVIQRLSLVPQTAYYRRLIWRFGVQSVEDHPIFGIGFQAYKRLNWMPSSVDNHWLMLAIRHGLLVPLAVLTVIAVTVARLAAQSTRMNTEADRTTYVALSYTVFSATLLASTVALFGGAQAWFMSLLAFGVSLTPKLFDARGLAMRPSGSPGPVERGAVRWSGPAAP